MKLREVKVVQKLIAVAVHRSSHVVLDPLHTHYRSQTSRLSDSSSVTRGTWSLKAVDRSPLSPRDDGEPIDPKGVGSV